MPGLGRRSSSFDVPISEADERAHRHSSPQLVRSYSTDDAEKLHNGRAGHGHFHVKFAIGDSENDIDDDVPHNYKPRSRRNSMGILDLNEDWITRNHFLERLEADGQMSSDEIAAKLAEIKAEQPSKEVETCRHKTARYMTATAFTIFILIIALLDATVTITGVILQIHSEHEEIIVRRSQSKLFTNYTRYAYGGEVDLQNLKNTQDMLDRVGKCLNSTQNATTCVGNGANNTSGGRSIKKRDLLSLDLQYSDIDGFVQVQHQSGSRTEQSISNHRHPGSRNYAVRSRSRTRRSDRADDTYRGERVLHRQKRAAKSADGTPLFESELALKLANTAHYLHYASIALLSILLIEVIVKMFVLGCEFFKSKVEVIDLIIISVAFTLDVYFVDSVMDNVAAAILLFIWQMIRVCTTLIIQDRKRIEFLLDVVRESNESNKTKVDQYQERNNSLQTAVNRLTTLATYKGATDSEIKRCTEIIQNLHENKKKKRKNKRPPRTLR